jgi:hypothetical protein
MIQAFFIMRMWQTGNIGSHNIKKADINPEDGFETYEEAKAELLNLSYNGEWEVKNASYTFTIVEVFKPSL